MWVLARKIAVMPLVSAVVVMVFGTLTLVLQDDHFIKMKPTMVNALFGVLLLGGLVFRRPCCPMCSTAWSSSPMKAGVSCPSAGACSSW